MSDQYPIRTIMRQDVDVIICHIVRCQEACERLIERIRLEDFDDALEKGYKLIFAIASEFYRKHSRVIPWDIM